MPLTGVWMNELNSIMVLNEGKDGSLTGKYRSIVGRDPHIRDLSGRASDIEAGRQMLGFAVQFHIDDPGPVYGHFSLCTWSGWAKDVSDTPKIRTHWLLTLSVLSDKDEWSSTLIGEDEFEKVLDAPDERHLEADKETLRQLLSRARA